MEDIRTHAPERFDILLLPPGGPPHSGNARQRRKRRRWEDRHGTLIRQATITVTFEEGNACPSGAGEVTVRPNLLR